MPPLEDEKIPEWELEILRQETATVLTNAELVGMIHIPSVPEGTRVMPSLEDHAAYVKETYRRHDEEGEPLPKGWTGIGFVNIDGMNWPLSVAAKLLDIPEKDLRDLVRITGLQPAGEIRMSAYSRQGRQPRAYPATKLIKLCEVIADLRNDL